MKLFGILNVTPDSFSDGNKYFDENAAVEHGLELVEAGADVIDIGGESTRPGAERISSEVELKRVIPVIEKISHYADIPISIDTTKAEVAREALRAGASIINDVSALRFDDDMLSVLHNNADVPIVLMHMKGTPKDMQKDPHYEDTIGEILAFFRQRITYCIENGIALHRLIIDPGIGFGKRFKDNMIIMKNLSVFHEFGVPVMLGASRKRFINQIYPSAPEERLSGSLATTAIAFINRVSFIRVHDVKEHKQFLQTMEMIWDAV